MKYPNNTSKQHLPLNNFLEYSHTDETFTNDDNNDKWVFYKITVMYLTEICKSGSVHISTMRNF